MYLSLCFSYGTKLDVWAAGVVTYLIICGSLPFGRYIITHTHLDPSVHLQYFLCMEPTDVPNLIFQGVQVAMLRCALMSIIININFQFS